MVRAVMLASVLDSAVAQTSSCNSVFSNQNTPTFSISYSYYQYSIFHIHFSDLLLYSALNIGLNRKGRVKPELRCQTSKKARWSPGRWHITEEGFVWHLDLNTSIYQPPIRLTPQLHLHLSIISQKVWSVKSSLSLIILAYRRWDVCGGADEVPWGKIFKKNLLKSLRNVERHFWQSFSILETRPHKRKAPTLQNLIFFNLCKYRETWGKRIHMYMGIPQYTAQNITYTPKMPNIGHLGTLIWSGLVSPEII